MANGNGHAKPSGNYLHVSCIVKDDGRLWELLRALEASRAGNVEVRPVAPLDPPTVTQIAPTPEPAKPETKPLALPAPAPKRKARSPQQGRANGTKAKVLAAMRFGVATTVGELVKATGLPLKSVQNCTYQLKHYGIARRLADGSITLNRPMS